MAEYVALYRKFRPLTFNNMVGQEHIIKVLKHQIANNSVGHAYLFCGSRGTGKTSTAKIFARAINCTSSADGEPCNTCDVCKGILSGSVPDVMEIDAASNNSVDNIRSIRENVIYAPAIAKYKVYIIDEVHMLSGSAFNALLKTLEEPPSHVIFILATTEPHKIPITILSRCQRFEFKRIPVSDIAKRLKLICDENNVTSDEKSLMLIAKSAEGALRDAISLLDQIISSGVKDITEDVVRTSLGIVSTDTAGDMLYALLGNNIVDALSLINSVIASGKDIKYFVWEIISLARDVMVYKVTKDESLLNNYSSIEQVKKFESYDTDRFSQIISNFSELENELKTAVFPNVLLESSIIKFLTPKVSYTAPIIQESPKTATPSHIEAIKKAEPDKVQKTKEAVFPIDNKDFENDWKKIITNLKDSGKMSLYATLVNTKGTVNDGMLYVYFSKPFGKAVIEKPENMQILKDAVMSVTGKELPVKCVVESVKSGSAIDDLENTLLSSGINVSIE